jgi:hypothetical protein
MSVLAGNPDRLLAFDRLRELVRMAVGNEHFLLTPVSALCPLHSQRCQNPQQLLSPANALHNFERHLRLAHAGEPRAEQLLKRLEYVRAHPHCTLSELAARAAPFELSASDRQPDDRRDLLLRMPPRRLHWVARWLNVLLTEPRSTGGEPRLTMQHVLVQMVVFLLFLVFPQAAWRAMWETQLPQLFHFAGAVLYISKEMGYRLMRGRVLFGKGRLSEVLYPITRWWPLGGEDGLIAAEVQTHAPWMVHFGDVGTMLRCEHVPTLRMAIDRRVVAPADGAPLCLVLRVVSGSISLLSPMPATGLKLRRVREVDCNDINVPLPQPTVLRHAELPARHTSGPNYHVIAAFLEIAPTLSPPPPLLRNDSCVVVLVSQKFDKRPLNQCGYSHVCSDDSGVPTAKLLGLYEKADGGALTEFTAERCEELVAEGPAVYRRALAQVGSTLTLTLAITLI